MEIKYKKLNHDDLEEFIRLRIAQLKEEGSKSHDDITANLRQYYNKHLQDGTFVSWVAVDKDKIIATSGMSLIEKPPYYGNPTGKIGILSSMFTVHEYRRKGIAKHLLGLVVDEAKIYGCGAVQITASDAGVLLYTDFGFVKNSKFMQYTI